MVEKKEGNTMTCNNCGSNLICRVKDYGGGFEAKPQWQNEDGTAHYSTNDGKTYTCHIPTGMDGFEGDIQTQESTVETNTVSTLDEITGGYVDNQITLIQQVEKRVFEVLGKDTNVAKIGMYVKLILEGVDKK